MKRYEVEFKVGDTMYVTCVYASNIYRARFVAWDTHPAINQAPYSITQIRKV
ncbi:hypothetical protein [Synechococcus phage S-N03]|uniref:Uncharacterized protein n=1 Tax=Synechococcus phage S-N03 TaxID=2718943 RepID=A0A6G8R5L1_9CAUD|nr:hypothetical protein PQC09_gp028 [Synechococcus phage S-N03]QIN96663.1 hypothetical protein [Synechococcus phage S-N03]